MSIEFQVHWFSITIWKTMKEGLEIWKTHFEKYLGPMIPSGHGGKGFQMFFEALLGSKLYARPVGQQGVCETYFNIEVPGSACEALPPKVIQAFLLEVEKMEKANMTRLDFAWDGVAFTPHDVKLAVEARQFRSHLRRKTLFYGVEPLETKEDGTKGTTSLRVGSLSSQRLLRVYDKRGPVRIELMMRAKRADAVAKDVLTKNPTEWPDVAKEHLRDYIDFQDEDAVFLGWWQDFIKSTARARMQVTDAREKELKKMTEWLMEKVSATYSAVIDVLGPDLMLAMLRYGRKHRGHRFDAILELNRIKEGRVDE
jgi:DNA relaxase NicK